MRIPTLQGLIRRRILVNYRADPRVVQPQLPVGFSPKLHRGHAVVGICLIRLESIRPRGVPALLGLASENAAHRIAVEWHDELGQRREGVYVPRRDTNSWLNHQLGGTLFPGYYHRARFTVAEDRQDFKLAMRSVDREVQVELNAQAANNLPHDSIFASLDETSKFFRTGSLGLSPRFDTSKLDAMLLHTEQWQVAPLQVQHLTSSYFADTQHFPTGSVAFDHALIMRDVEHQWRSASAISFNRQL